MTRRSFFVIVALLLIAGIGTACLRHIQTGEPFLPGVQTQVWQVEARVSFDADQLPVSVSLALPSHSPGFRLFSEQAASPGYGFAIVEKDGQRRGSWTKQTASGRQVLYYKAEFVADAKQKMLASTAQPLPVFWQEPAGTAANQLLAAAMKTSSNTASLVRELVKRLNSPQPSQNAALLLDQKLDRAQLLATLLNQAGDPARVVTGLYLEDARRQQALTNMVKVYTKDSAIIVNPVSGQQGVPDDLLLWNTSENGVLNVTGGHASNVSFSMIKRSVPAQQLARSQASKSLFDLLGVHLLPIESQSMFKMLFLLPIGALVVVFMRLLIGIKTSGTFMPVLISLAFLQTTLVPGLVSFIVIVALGLVLRSYLSYLNLLMVARISTLIVLVITIIAFMSLISYELGLTTGISISFFPMIIIAWTIERSSILWEEEGPREVLVQGFGSLFVAVLAYGLMTTPLVSHLSFNFPELNLVVIAAILLMGQYTGYRLSELHRFHDVVEDIERVD